MLKTYETREEEIIALREEHIRLGKLIMDTHGYEQIEYQALLTYAGLRLINLKNQ